MKKKIDTEVKLSLLQETIRFTRVTEFIFIYLLSFYFFNFKYLFYFETQLSYKILLVLSVQSSE